MTARTIFIALLLYALPSHSQTIDTLSGRFISRKGEPLFGNVLVLAPGDSSLIKTANVQHGTFRLTGIGRERILVKFTSVLFKDTVITVSYDGKRHMNLGTIYIDERSNTLNEVRIAARAPAVRQTANGNTEVRVAGTMLASSNSATEMLSRLPNVTLDEGGQARVAGKGEALLYLNGKLITPERLSAVPPSQIVRIDVIANPSAKYDAAGRAVINIITQANTAQGFLGKFSQQVTSSPFAGTNANTLLDLSLAHGKWSLAGNYGLLAGNEREMLHTIRNRPQPDVYLNSDLTTNWRRRFAAYHQYGMGIGYNWSARTNASLDYNGNNNHLGGTIGSDNLLATTAGESNYNSQTAKNDKRHHHNLTFNFNKILDSLGSGLFLGSQYADYRTIVRDEIKEHNRTGTQTMLGDLKSHFDQQITISSTQLDGTKFFNAAHRLEAGAKFSYVNTGAGTRFFISDRPDGEYVEDDGRSNHFRYREKITAAYASYNGKAGKLNITAGMRGEWTNYQLRTLDGNATVGRNNYVNLFPSMLLSWSGKAVKWRTSYTARISRPRYETLNPSVVYQDPLTTIEGNPYLMPEKTRAFEAGVSYRTFDLKMVYSHTIDPMSGGALRGSTPNSYVLKRFNIDKSDNYAILLSGNIERGKWSSSNTISWSYTREVDRKHGFDLYPSKPQWYLYTNHTFAVNRTLQLLLLAWYQGEEYSGLFYRRSRANVTLGVSQSLLNNQLKLSMSANDIFDQSAYVGNYRVGQTDIYYKRKYTLNYFRATMTYSFGNLKQSTFKNKATGSAETGRAN